MEQVSKRMMEELENAHSLNEILDSMYDDKKCKCIDFDYWYLKSYLKYNDFSDETYLKIIKHINGEPQFEAEKTKKYIVRSKQADDQGDFIYLSLEERYGLTYSTNTYDFYTAEKIDTREEAEEWKNPLTEVIEVEG